MGTSLMHWVSKSTCNILMIRGLANWKKEYSEQKDTGFTVEQMFEVVSDVENYYKFLPFCQKSVVHKKSERELFGELQVGFPPLIESYISKVTLRRPYLVKAECTDGKLFEHLTTTWRFTKIRTDGASRSVTNLCKVANIFFDQLVTQMQSAFFKEARRRFGIPSAVTTPGTREPT